MGIRGESGRKRSGPAAGHCPAGGRRRLAGPTPRSARKQGSKGTGPTGGTGRGLEAAGAQHPPAGGGPVRVGGSTGSGHAFEGGTAPPSRRLLDQSRVGPATADG